MQNKRYYWLKLKNDFFEGDEIGWLEEQENGAVYILFYLKLCLRSLRSDGILMRRVGKMEIPYDTKKLAEITGVPLAFAESAMELLTSAGLVEVQENGALFLPQIENMTGSETERTATLRKQRMHQKKQEAALEEHEEKSACKVCTDSVQNVRKVCTETVQTSTPEKEKESEKELELESESEKEPDAEIESLLYPEKDGLSETRTTTAAQKRGVSSEKGLDKAAQWVRPELEEIAAYCTERQNGIDPEQFYDYYEANGWRMGQNPMYSWKAAVRTWERKTAGSSGKHTPEPEPPLTPGIPEEQSPSVYASFVCNPC